jgi:Co/Zn/Cd efflux system component
MSRCECDLEIKNRGESKVLIILLLINAVMFFTEFVAGWLAESTGLIADSLDMLADALVYGVALYAVGKTIIAKSRAAFLSGYLQMFLGTGILIDIVRRAITGSEPISILMILVSFIALIANVICLFLLNKHRKGEVHMRATWIFTRNDVIANLGVITAGVTVALTGSSIPDLIIGFIICAVVTKGGLQIVTEAKETRRGQPA